MSDLFLSETRPPRVTTVDGTTVSRIDVADAQESPLPLLIAGEVVYPPGSTLGPREQRALELVIVHAGYMTVSVDGREHLFPEHSVNLLLPDRREMFWFAADVETHHSWIEFVEPRLSNALQGRLEALPKSLALSHRIAQSVSSILKLSESFLPTRGELQYTHAVQAFWEYVTEAERVASRDDRSPIVALAQQIVEGDLADDLTLDNLARAVGVSKGHLSRLFKRDLGQTPADYIWTQRLEMGVALVENTGLTLKEIALRTGFKSVYHFSRRVKQHTGSPPSQLRATSRSASR